MPAPTESWTVNDVVRCFPKSIAVLNNLGIDTCCGGSETLDIAAHGAGLTSEFLVAALIPCTVPAESQSQASEPGNYVI